MKLDYALWPWSWEHYKRSTGSLSHLCPSLTRLDNKSYPWCILPLCAARFAGSAKDKWPRLIELSHVFDWEKSSFLSSFLAVYSPRVMCVTWPHKSHNAPVPYPTIPHQNIVGFVRLVYWHICASPVTRSQWVEHLLNIRPVAVWYFWGGCFFLFFFFFSF